MYDNRCPRPDFPSRCMVDSPTGPYHLARRIAYYDDGVRLKWRPIVGGIPVKRGRT